MSRAQHRGAALGLERWLRCTHTNAERELPGLLGGDVLCPRAHEGCGTCIPGVAFEGIAFEHPPTTADPHRFLGQGDDRTLHRDVCRPSTLHSRQRGSTCASEIAR